MFHGYNWQTRTLEVRPDRIPPDFDGQNPTIIPPGGFQSPGNSALPLVARDRTLDCVTGPLFPGLPPQSLPTVPTNPEDFLALSRPSTATASRNLFVGNVSALSLSFRYELSLPQLPFHCQWQDLKDLFRQAGTILRADVALGPDGRSRGFGTVAFASEIDAERAVKMFNG